MIDLGEQFKRMAQEFDIEDKVVLKSIRTMLREAWGSSIFKQEFLKNNSVLVENTNTRSMKRFPYVRRYKCAMCGEYFGSTETELDHLVSENALTSYEHINDFFTNIILTSPDKLQVLCKDKKTKKDGVVRFGCHNLKSYSERYNVSLEQAKAEKQAIELIKQKKDKLYLQQYGISVPSNAAARRKAIVEHLLTVEAVN